jgi:hypothetical protein
MSERIHTAAIGTATNKIIRIYQLLLVVIEEIMSMKSWLNDNERKGTNYW